MTATPGLVVQRRHARPSRGSSTSSPRIGVAPPAGLGRRGLRPRRVPRSDGDGPGRCWPASTPTALSTPPRPCGSSPPAARSPASSVVDQPSMARRGTIEGFYGSPWTPAGAARPDGLLRRRSSSTPTSTPPRTTPTTATAGASPTRPTSWPSSATLVDAAAANHVRFTFAVSPGVSICYSDPADRRGADGQARGAVRPRRPRVLDRARRHRPHRAGTAPATRPPTGPRPAAPRRAAQVDAAQRGPAGFVAAHPDALPLQMVPDRVPAASTTAPTGDVARAGSTPASW